MKPTTTFALAAVSISLWATCAFSADKDGFADDFSVGRSSLTSAGRNPYVVLEPDYQLIYESSDRAKPARLITTVLDKTESIAGIEARVVESVELADGLPRRVTRTYLAIDKSARDVYVLGRDVERFDGWRSAGRNGSWRAGERGARWALLVPGSPQVGQKFYESLASKNSNDRAEVASVTETVRVPASRFENCLKLVESTTANPKPKSQKLYAPNVGLLEDGAFKLVRYGKSVEPRPDVERLIAAAKEKAKAAGELTEPLIPHDTAREALAGVGVDPDAEHMWMTAINDPALSPHQRSDLIEDLNESGFEDPAHVQAHELPIVLNRLALIEDLAPGAMDDTNAAAFAEAYKDLVNIANRLTRQ